jgi:iron complex outermembrane receptor protein
VRKPPNKPAFGEEAVGKARPIEATVRARKTLAVACSGTLAALGAPADAQDATESRGTIRIEVTGSHISRSEVESALPVQVLTREDIERSGSVTVAELMSKVSANVLGLNEQLSINNFVNPGLSSVNLRGIGSGNTLVLLNGRRVANYAFDGSAVDVNAIPLAAVERVEILKDGASAIYGTDAVAGVVNFILRKNYSGVEFTGYGNWPEQGGGEQYQAVASAGFGDLVKDRYNVFVTAVYQKDEPLAATERAFSRTGYRPAEGILRLSPTTFPANIYASPENRIYNPSFARGCAPPYSLPSTNAGAPGDACGFDYVAYSMIVPKVERTAAYGRGTLQASTDHQLFAEVAYSDNRLAIRRDPTNIAPFTNPNFVVTPYPAGGPFYPAEFAAENGLSGDLDIWFRTVSLGPRTSQVDTSAWRAVLGAEGVLAGWDYSAALTYSRNDQGDSLGSGHVSLTRFSEAMATGFVNPFGPSGPEGDALLAATQVSGEFHTARGTTFDLLVNGSREIVPLPGGPLALAVGAEARRERLSNDYSALATTGDLPGLPVAVQSASGSRSVQALFVEASVPFAKGFEAQLAARYDHYRDFGSTWNPKLALRWQPIRSLLLRTSWGTGFRAPPLYDLYTPQEQTFLLGFEDPLRCPVTESPRDCAVFPAVIGGNPGLQPETSEQFNAGVVWEPFAGLSIAIDYWRIAKSNLIGALSEVTIFDNFARYAPTNIVRGPVDPQHPDLPGPISNVLLTNQNLGNLKTSGIDVDVAWRGAATSIGRFSFALNGTYITEWKLQTDGVTYESALGRNASSVPGPFPRWKHYAALDWEHATWGIRLAQTFQSGYEDTNIFPVRVPAPLPRSVSSYEVWDLQARYTGWRNTKLVVGVRNLFDRDPPFTNQPFSYQVGYDPNYADPRGRTFYASVTYTFK